MKEIKRVRRTVFPRQIFTAAIIFALLSTLFFFSPVQFRALAQTADKSNDGKYNNSPLVSSNIVISQVYGGGGNSGATYTNDFIELFNRGNTAVSLSGWSVQYTSSTGTSWAVTTLTNVMLQPGQYYLVQETAGSGGTTALPTPDTTGNIGMSGTSGKVLVANVTTTASGTDGSNLGASRIDVVSYGTSSTQIEGTPTANLNNTTSARRLQNGCMDTDMNNADFEIITAFQTGNPRNTSSPQNPCGGGGTTVISISNPSVLEGNSGTTTATFTVSLSSAAGAGDVTFDIATQDNTATVADNDYVEKSLTGQTIAAGNSTYNFDVTINGDTNVEPNETFFVNVTNVTGATPTSIQGTGTIINDETTQINQIQGGGSTSPLAGRAVTTGGIVTATKNNGFFLQTPDANVDADSNTSEGIFVFTSSTPPAAATIGNLVNVSGTVAEFVPSAAPNQPPVTEIVTPTVSFISSGNALPVPITITAADTTPNNLENLERLEGMRVRVNSLTVVAPTQGNITESSATVSSNGLFYGVVTGVARPFREPGIDLSINPPAGAPANVPRFDTNPERLRIDSDAQPGAAKLDVAAGEIVSNIVGPLDYAFVTWSIYPDAATLPTVTNIKSATPVLAAAADEFTVASFNMQRFFDTVDDPGTSDPVLTPAAFNGRLNKASLAVRNVMRSPDVIGVEEMENLTTLQAVANKINNDTVTAGQPDPNYQAYLVEGNDVGGIDVGFLVKSSRVKVIDVAQIGKTATYTNPNTGAADLLNDRPPLVLRASIQPTAGAPVLFTVIVNHLRSLSGANDPVNGNRIRTKRRAQAEYLADLIQGRQTTDPNERIISVGDYNAFQFNDGYVDSIGTIKGDPTPADQVVLASGDLVNPNLTDLLDFLPPTERYSFSFDGNAQVLDHELVNNKMLEIFNRIAYARNNADFPEIYYQDSTRPERISDHDIAVAYFSLTGTGISGQGLEADVATRFSGDGVYQANDPSLIEEFLIFAKTPDPSFNEFQRADCAPYSTRGDGRLDITDVNQAEQYLISAVAQQTAGGPTQSIPPPAAQEQNSPALGKVTSKAQKAALLPKVVKAGDVSTSAGQTIVVPILIDAEGDETGYSFTLDYDPTILTNTAILDGDVGGTRAFVIGNAPNNGVAKGKTTFSLRNFTGGPNRNAVPRGNSQVLVRVQFSVNAGAAAGTTPLTFSGMPTANSITDANSQPLTAQFNAGTITITGTTAAGAAVSGRVQNGTGRGVANAQVIMTNSLGERQIVRTNWFGYFRLAEVATGETYTVTVKSKQYRFTPQVVNVTQDLDYLNFTAQPR